MNFPVAIIAGGLATRLHPITLKVPKSLVNVRGKPFISWQLKLLVEQDVREVVLCLGHKSSEIVEFVGSGKKFGLSVTYSIEEKPLGTAGALLNASKLLGEDFGMLYGDSFLPINYNEVEREFVKRKKPALVTIFENSDFIESSNIEYNGNRIVEYSKIKKSRRMRFIEYGFNMLNKSIFTEIPQDNFCDLSEVLRNLIAKNQVEAFEIKNRFYEVGSLKGIQELELYLGEIPNDIH